MRAEEYRNNPVYVLNASWSFFRDFFWFFFSSFWDSCKSAFRNSSINSLSVFSISICWIPFKIVSQGPLLGILRILGGSLRSFFFRCVLYESVGITTGYSTGIASNTHPEVASENTPSVLYVNPQIFPFRNLPVVLPRNSLGVSCGNYPGVLFRFLQEFPVEIFKQFFQKIL